MTNFPRYEHYQGPQTGFQFNKVVMPDDLQLGPNLYSSTSTAGISTKTAGEFVKTLDNPFDNNLSE